MRFHGIGADQEQIRHQCGGVAIGCPRCCALPRPSASRRALTGRTRCTRTEGRPGLGWDLATAFGTPRSEGSRSRWLEGSMGAGGPRSGAAAAAEGRAQDRPRQTETGRAASGVRRVSAAGLVRRTWPFPVGGMLVGRNPATPKNRLISNRNGSPPGTRCASLPQAQDDPEAPAGPWGRPELF